MYVGDIDLVQVAFQPLPAQAQVQFGRVNNTMFTGFIILNTCVQMLYMNSTVHEYWYVLNIIFKC